MLFFLLALWRESWLAVVAPSAERLNIKIQLKTVFLLIISHLFGVIFQCTCEIHAGHQDRRPGECGSFCPVVGLEVQAEG